MLAKARSLPSLTILQVSGCRTLRHTWHSHYSLSGSTKTRKPESFKCAFHFWGGNHPWRQTHLAKSWCLGYSLASGVYKYRNRHTNTNTNINTNTNTNTNVKCKIFMLQIVKLCVWIFLERTISAVHCIVGISVFHFLYLYLYLYLYFYLFS